jgi:hypothetical protein
LFKPFLANITEIIQEALSDIGSKVDESQIKPTQATREIIDGSWNPVY